VYEIYNKNDNDDKNTYIGSTVAKFLSSRWGAHRFDVRKGKQTKLHIYMREKGLENFACRLLHKQEIESKNKDVVHKIEQKFISELNPSLNTNNCFGLKNSPSDGKRKFTDNAKNDNDYQKNYKEYCRGYHKTYQVEYYKKNKQRKKTKCKVYYDINKEILTKTKNEKNSLIRASNKYRCEICSVSLVSPSALKKHYTSKKHIKASNQ
jgi:hypothetical protein